MQKIYSRINWENFPSEKTAVNESNLNKMDLAIDNLDDRVVAMDASKVDLTKANELVKEILWDESNGKLTVVKMNGSRAVIDTKLEKLAVNFTYNPQTQQLVITLDDGTVQNVDLSSLITEYEFLDSDTIAFEITDGKVKAIVKNGSITENHLAPEYLAEIRTQVGRAEMSAKSADASEKSAVSSSTLAKSYAVGGTGTRDGEDTDNAKYYAEQAKNASDVGALSEIVENHISNKTIHMTESEHDVVYKLGESAEGTLTFNGKDVIGSTITVDDALSPTSTNPVQNKVVTSNLTDLRKGAVANLLKPILQTTTRNGITCTNNGDGTYTFNGTATAGPETECRFDVQNIKDIAKKNIHNDLWLVGCPKNGGYNRYRLQFWSKEQGVIADTGAGVKINIESTIGYIGIGIVFGVGVTVNNLVFKPMLTTNLSATYDDFVPYTGDTGRLNGDVAELKAQSVKKDDVVNNQTTTVQGFALDARQANPNIDGSLAKQISDLNGSLNFIFNVPQMFTSFANIPDVNGVHIYCVANDGVSIPDSPYPGIRGWWNVINFGYIGRMTQITSQVYKTADYDYKGKDELWIRSLHDATWSEWVKL